MKVVPFRVTPGMGKYVCGEQLRITNLQQQVVKLLSKFALGANLLINTPSLPFIHAGGNRETSLGLIPTSP